MSEKKEKNHRKHNKKEYIKSIPFENASIKDDSNWGTPLPEAKWESDIANVSDDIDDAYIIDIDNLLSTPSDWAKPLKFKVCDYTKGEKVVVREDEYIEDSPPMLSLNTEEEIKLSKRICHQIEFYFSDRNYFFDKYLQKIVNLSPDQWVPIDLICGFSKIKSYSTDKNFIISAVKQSKTILEISEDNNFIRRNPILPIPTPKQLKSMQKYDLLPPLPPQVLSFFRAGTTLYKEHKWIEAVEMFTKAIEVSPYVEGRLFTNRAICYMQLRMYKEAEEDCSKVIEWRLTNDLGVAKTAFTRGLSFFRRKMYMEAMKDFHRSLSKYETKLARYYLKQAHYAFNYRSKQELIAKKKQEEEKQMKLEEEEGEEFFEDEQIQNEALDLIDENNDTINNNLHSIQQEISDNAIDDNHLDMPE